MILGRSMIASLCFLSNIKGQRDCQIRVIVVKYVSLAPQCYPEGWNVQFLPHVLCWASTNYESTCLCYHGPTCMVLAGLLWSEEAQPQGSSKYSQVNIIISFLHTFKELKGTIFNSSCIICASFSSTGYLVTLFTERNKYDHKQYPYHR